MSQPIRVVIADDHVLVLDGLRQALDALPDIQVIAVATTGDELASVLERVDPDVILVDIEMPGRTGLSVLRDLKDPPPALVVTMHTEDEYRQRAAAAGAVGFLSKATPLPELAAAVRAAHDGVILLDVDDLGSALAPYREARLSPGAESLTARERELLALLAGGISGTDELAEEMFISQKTVKNHLASIYEKLGISDRAQAVVEAIRLGLDRPPDR
ncbi:MAG: response regulator transcription factor [Acidobacteria bacterium]|nr:response regulator transcription factor [Acidobacteriota bacterium]